MIRLMQIHNLKMQIDLLGEIRRKGAQMLDVFIAGPPLFQEFFGNDIVPKEFVGFPEVVA